MTTIVQAETPEQIETAGALFREYEAWLALERGAFKSPNRSCPRSGLSILAVSFRGCVKTLKDRAQQSIPPAPTWVELNLSKSENDRVRRLSVVFSNK
jgi:hypothetical protein